MNIIIQAPILFNGCPIECTINIESKIKLAKDNILEKDNKCNCKYRERPCYECEYNKVHRCPPTLASDCIVVNSLICSEKLHLVAELSVPIPTLGDIISIGPGGVITPLISLTPNLGGIVNQVTIIKNMVVITGYLPANVTIL